MKDPIKIFITGITGKQGGSVARNLKGSEVQLKGVTRSANSAKAIAMQQAGVEIIEGNLDEPDSFVSHLEDIDVFFLVQAFKQGAKVKSNKLKESLICFVIKV